MYLLFKARTKEDYKIAILSGLAFTITISTWKGSVFLFALPFIAIGVYHLIMLILKEDLWKISKLMMIACGIPTAINFLVFKPFQVEITQVASFGFIVVVGILSEYVRVKFFKKEDNKTDLEKRIFKFLVPLVIIGMIGGLLVFGEKILDIPNQAYAEFAGVSAHNFLVDKTISEQSSISTGDFIQKLKVGYNYYGVGEILTIVALIGLPILFIGMYYFKQRSNILFYLRAYIFALGFFLVAMNFVWVEARLAFSQSLGFIFLGSLVGIVAPMKPRDLLSLRIISGLAIFFLIIGTVTFVQFQSMVDPYWFEGVRWLDENTPPNTYVLTWWDYGHFITALSHDTVIADPLQAGENYILQIARFFQGFSSEEQAMAWLKAQTWNVNDQIDYIILDYSLIGKSSAMTFLAKNYYEYPNGELPIDGICYGSFPCANTLGQCCTTSFNWRVIPNEGGSAVITREARDPVYDEYRIDTEHTLCAPMFVTNPNRHTIILSNESIMVKGSYLYVAYGDADYSDGNTYPGFVLFRLDNDETLGVMITQDCQIANINDILATGNDDMVNLGFGAKVGDDNVPQLFIHVPKEWKNTMFTQLYLYDAKNLKDWELVSDGQTSGFFPAVKIFRRIR